MKSTITLSFIIFLSGCLTLTAPAPGLLYTQAKYDGSAVQGNYSSAKRGDGCISAYLWVFSTGDASISAIANNAGITKISAVDHRVFSVLFGAINSYYTIVTGA